MKILLVFTLLIAVNGTVSAQGDVYYYSHGKRIALEYDRSLVELTYYDSLVLDSAIYGIRSIENRIEIGENLFVSRVSFTSELQESAYNSRVQSLLSVINVLNFAPVVIINDSSNVAVGNTFHIKLNSLDDTIYLQDVAFQENVEIIGANQFMPLWYKLKIHPKNLKSAISLTNDFFETGLFASIDPDFHFDFSIQSCNTNDYFIDEQWGLEAVGACDAWSYSEGAGVNVAIIDHGICKTHNDLATNISPLSYNSMIFTSQEPSVYVSGQNHGTFIAGIIGAEKNNSFQIAGAAPQCKMISVSNNNMHLTNGLLKEQLANGISWAWINGADIINCSWGYNTGQLNGQVLEDAILDAMSKGRNGLGTVVVFASGNSDSNVTYPGTFHPQILVVGGMNPAGTRGHNACYGPEVDVVAPNVMQLSTIGPNGWDDNKWGTSYAAPYVCATAALMLSINPCLNIKEVADIIESTATKTGGYNYQLVPGRMNGAWHEEMGYGTLNALASVQMASTFHGSGMDLSIRDRDEDTGFNAGYSWGWNLDESVDIWVRNTNDGNQNQEHQKPNYNLNPNYIYVRLTNKGCEPTAGLGTLNVYWSKAASNSSWPVNWDGTNPSTGNLINSVAIPNIDPGQSEIISVPWNVPNPWIFENWGTCILARIENLTGDLIVSYPNDLGREVYQNNNVSCRNTEVIATMVDDPPVVGGIKLPHGSHVYFGNVTNANEEHDLIFLVPEEEHDEPITGVAEVTLTLDSNTWDLLSPYFEGRTDIRRLSDRRIQLFNQKTEFKNVKIPANERYRFFVGFSFLTRNPSYKNEFRFHCLEKKSELDSLYGDHWTGGVHFTIKKENRDLFYANAGDDKTIYSGESIVLNGEQVSESADYSWLDKEGQVIHNGRTVEITPNESGVYKYEVVAQTDGFKDYDSININILSNKLISITPNPASDNITVIYNLDDEFSFGALSIINTTNPSIQYSVPLSINSGSIEVNVSDYAAGVYVMALTGNEQILDTKSLIISN